MTGVWSIMRTRAGKVFVFCWSLSALSLIGFILFGFADRDIAGATAVGVLVSAPFIDMAVLASYWAGRASHTIARATWLVLAVSLLASTLLLLGSGKSDADLLLAYGAAILSFPLGLVVGPLTGQISMPAGLALTTLLWILNIGAGVLQWFVLIPMCLKARARDRK
ncbi:MAG: hypothetical protein A3F78_13225 [Burkholderiales bacterium RIFCSPLOWO2_12_FULL_61_40]|nr:MAG: hypothetical protein A3F78_13225 [Burkholderiales bacterium RIFCSPLOWO2_12_FULL_61_40]